MFDPPEPFDLLADVAEAVTHFGRFEPPFIPWLAEKLAAHWNEDHMRVFPRDYQESIVKYARCDYVEALSALEVTIRRALERWHLAREYSRCRKLLAGQFIGPAVEINTRAPRVCCDHALALSGIMFTKAQQLPTLPLPLCDFEFCGCDYRSLTQDEYEKRLRAQVKT